MANTGMAATGVAPSGVAALEAGTLAHGADLTAVGGLLQDVDVRLDEAVTSARHAYRDTARLIRLLAVIGAPRAPGELVSKNGRTLVGVVGVDHLLRVFRRLLDEDAFLSPYGLRAVSRWHLDHPYNLDMGGYETSIDYEPAESTTSMFGGNSNWRGPVWFPVNYLVVDALLRYARYFGDGLTMEYPTRSGDQRTFAEFGEDLRRRLISLFLVGEDGFQQVGAGAVLLLPAHEDTRPQALGYLILDSEVGLELLTQCLSDPQREQPLVIGQAVEQQDAVGDLLRMLHFFERLFAGVRGHLGEAPAVLHLGMQEILVDRRQLAGQLLVEQF